MNTEAARVVLLEHSRSKLNGLFPASVTHRHQLTNPICGDHVKIGFEVQNGVITETGFDAKACAICTASASLLCQEVRGLAVDDAIVLSHGFENALLAPIDEVWPTSLVPFESFEHLKMNPSRRTCALLPWVVLRSTFKEAGNESSVHAADPREFALERTNEA